MAPPPPPAGRHTPRYLGDFLPHGTDVHDRLMAMRFGLLGTGYWAAQTQAMALAAHPDAALVGVWGRNPEKANQLAERFGARTYVNVDDLLADVDAVAMALPPDVQAELAIAAAAAGRHLLLDKPLALSLAAADRVVAAVEQAGVSSVIFFTNRFFSSVADFLVDASTRSWHGARVTMFASIFQPGNPYGTSPWRREKGGLWDLGPHALSLILPVLGPVEEVVGMRGPRHTAHVLLRHRAGGVSTVALTLDAPPAATAHEAVFYGPDGTVAVPAGDATAVEAFGTAVSQLVAAASSRKTSHPCDVRFGREVVAVLEAAERELR